MDLPTLQTLSAKLATHTASVQALLEVFPTHPSQADSVRSESPAGHTQEEPVDSSSGDEHRSVSSQGQPTDPLITHRQKMLMMHFEMLGVIGMVLYMRDVAEDEREREIKRGISPVKINGKLHYRGSKSWTTLINDIDRGLNSRTLFYLASLPPRMIPALIRGDLPSCMQESSFRDEVAPHVQLRDTQGTYVIYVARSSPLSSTQITGEKVGYGLSYKQLIDVVAAMRLYIDMDHKDSEKLARDIDVQYGYKAGLDHQRQRKYASGSGLDQIQDHLRWLNDFEYQYLHWAKQVFEEDPGDARLVEYLRRCLVYVGLGHSVLHRVPDHWVHAEKESPIFGLFSATVKALFGDDYSIREFSYQIFKTCQPEDVGLDEIITSMFSALWLDGGLNITHCGTQTGKGGNNFSPEQMRRLQRNAESIQRSGFLDKNLNDAHDKWLRIRVYPKLCAEVGTYRTSVEKMLAETKKLKNQVDSQIESLKSSVEDAVFDELEAALKEFIADPGEAPGRHGF